MGTVRNNTLVIITFILYIPSCFLVQNSWNNFLIGSSWLILFMLDEDIFVKFSFLSDFDGIFADLSKICDQKCLKDLYFWLEKRYCKTYTYISISGIKKKKKKKSWTAFAIHKLHESLIPIFNQSEHLEDNRKFTLTVSTQNFHVILFLLLLMSAKEIPKTFCTRLH